MNQQLEKGINGSLNNLSIFEEVMKLGGTEKDVEM